MIIDAPIKLVNNTLTLQIIKSGLFRPYSINIKTEYWPLERLKKGLYFPEYKPVSILW